MTSKAPDLKIHSFKYFLQPNIALKKNNFFSLAFSPKFVWVKTDLNYHSFDSLKYELGGNTGVVYFEPTIDMRVGRLVKFRVQIKFVQALENPVPYYSNIILSTGLQVDLDDIFSDDEKPDE